MPLHPVIDQTIHRTPLDAEGVVAFALSFLAVTVIAARRPAYGVAVMIALVPFAFYRDVGATTITLPKVALLANAVALLIARKAPYALRRPAAATILVCGALVVLGTALSIRAALYVEPAIRETFKSIEYLLLFSVVVVATSCDPDRRPIRLALLGSVVLVGFLAIAQELTGAPSGVWFENHPIPRIAGPLEGPNQLAGYLGIALAVVAAFALRERFGAFEAAALGIGSCALVLTISRAGVAASLAGIAIVFAVVPSPARRAAATAIGAGCAAGVLIIAAWGLYAAHAPAGVDLLLHFSSTAESANPGSVGNRSQIWHAVFVLWSHHPFFGIGAGNFERELGAAGYPKLHTHANSLYLQALVEGGIPLAAATVALVGASIARFVRGPFDDALVAAALGANVGLAIHQVFDLLVFYPKVGELWWIVLALGAFALDARTRATEVT